MNTEELKEYKRQWAIRNADKVRASRLRYAKANIEKVMEAKRKYVKNNPEKVKESKKKYYENNHEKDLESHRESSKRHGHVWKRRWIKRNKDKTNAHIKVYAAIKKGILVRGPCSVCGSANSQGHHSDYSKPLDVIWLCPLHHKQAHVMERNKACTPSTSDLPAMSQPNNVKPK